MGRGSGIYTGSITTDGGHTIVGHNNQIILNSNHSPSYNQWIHQQPSVYLDQFDINENGKLPLLPNSNKKDQLSAYAIYFFYYLILADKVYIQGSAALKSDVIYGIYHQFSECFRRNEYNIGMPLASFALRESCDGYYDYFRSREAELKENHATDNAEYKHYEKNNAVNVAAKLDRELSSVQYKRREKSVDKEFRRLVKEMFRDQSFCKKHNIMDEVQSKAIGLCDNLELFQTYKLLDELGLSENKFISHSIREQYFVANGNGVSSKTTLASDSYYFDFNNVKFFFYSLGFSPKKLSRQLLNGSPIFKIRRLESFLRIKSMYFECDSAYEIRVLIRVIFSIRNKKPMESKALSLGHDISEIANLLGNFNKDIDQIQQNEMRMSINRY